MSPNSETDTLLSWPQNTSVRPRRRDPDDGPPIRRGTRRNPPYDLTLRPNSVSDTSKKSKEGQVLPVVV